MSFSKEKYAAIVPVTCGKKHGTAFFVSPNLLLTAWHVVSEGVRNKVPVYCTLRGGSIICDINIIAEDSDVVLLIAENYTHPVWIKLLALPHNVEKALALAGFPIEIGLGYDLFDFAIHHATVVTKREYDVVASPKELIPFHSYKGFSGSPIITDDGFGVGVLTDQLSSVIGFTSVYKVQEKLIKEGVPVETNWEDYDTSTYGYARCKAMTEKQVDSAGDRYSPNEHVDSDELKNDFRIFCDIAEQHKVDFVFVGKQVEDWYLDLCQRYPFAKTDYKTGQYQYLRYYLGDLREKINSNDETLQEYQTISKIEQEELYRWIAQLNVIYHTFQDTNYRCAFLTGSAGTGKTHFLCRLAKEHGFEYQAYILFGSQFKMGERFEEQVERLLEFTEGLKGLNDYMEAKGRYAIIIVDALNEGAGYAYWNSAVKHVPDIADKYSHVRFILSSRDPIPSDFLSDQGKWMMRTATNSVDPEKLKESYFTKYKINPNSVGKNIQEFANPLFLRIFCVSYKMIPAHRRDNISKPDLFGLYMFERNKQVVETVNEDPYRNVTRDFFRKLANYSLYYGYCNDVQREKARMYSKQVCPGRLWKQSLLYACLKENLLQESFDKAGNPCVEFEYENLGDYMRAFTLLSSKMDGEVIAQWLFEQKTLITQKRLSRTKFTHFVGALLSVGEVKTDAFLGMALKGKIWDEELMEALQYRGRYNKTIVSKFLHDGTMKIVTFLIRDVDVYGEDIIEGVHQTLMEMTLSERDLNWSVKLNELYDWNGREGFLIKKKNDNSGENRKLAVLEAWLLCSSYPELRAIVIRNLVDIFVESPEAAVYTCRLFEGCNDPYVTAGLYCAAYGMSLRIHDADVISKLGKVVYELNYKDLAHVPNDLMVRTWTMKILERAHSLNPQFGLWSQVRPPFATGHNPFELLNKAGGIYDKDYFGTSDGSHLLHYSMFEESDFNRYIIGTNSHLTDRVMLTMNTNEEVLLEDVAKIVGVRVMELGWNDKLGEYDNGKYSGSRFENEKERIGKKYQWLAYFDILGQLTDCCYLRKGRYGGKQRDVHEVNYPWYADYREYFDPALQAVNSAMIGIHFNIDYRPLKEESMEWFDDDNRLPELQLMLKDDKNEEWLWICGFDTETQHVGKNYRHRALHINSAFVRNEDSIKFAEWAKQQNYHGRWMPEHNDDIDYLWNEYPWADSYKQSLEVEQWERPYNNECPADVMVSYMSQLQEETRGFDSTKDFRASVYMPCEDMMKRLKLYNAERGIVRREEDNSIACIDYGLTGEDKTGMLMKRSILDQYLHETGYTLFWFILGEKIQRLDSESAMKDLSACWVYNLEEGLVELQPMHVVKREKPKPIEATPERVAALYQKNKEQGLTSREKIDLITMERALKEKNGDENY